MFKTAGSVVIIQSDTRINKPGEFTLAFASGLLLQYNCSKSLHKDLRRRNLMRYCTVFLVWGFSGFQPADLLSSSASWKNTDFFFPSSTCCSCFRHSRPCPCLSLGKSWFVPLVLQGSLRVQTHGCSGSSGTECGLQRLLFNGTASHQSSSLPCPPLPSFALMRTQSTSNESWKFLKESAFWSENILLCFYFQPSLSWYVVDYLLRETPSPLRDEKLQCCYMPNSCCRMNDLVQNESFI